MASHHTNDSLIESSLVIAVDGKACEVDTHNVTNLTHHEYEDTNMVKNSKVTTTPDTSECGSCITTSKHEFIDMLEELVLKLSNQSSSKRGKRRNVPQLYNLSTAEMQQTISDEYKAALFDNEKVDDTDINIHLHAASSLLDQFFQAQATIAKLNVHLPTNLHEEGYPTPDAFILGMIEAQIFTDFSTYLNSSEMDCVQSLVIASWIDNTLAKLDLYYPMIKKSSLWLLEYTKHTNNFLHVGVRSKMNIILQRIFSTWCDDEVCEGSGHDDTELVTSVVDVNINLAKRYLKNSLTADIMIIINEEVSTMVAEVMVVTCTKWTTFSINRMCSMINGSTEIIELLKHRNDQYLSTHESKEVGVQAVRDLHDLSLCVVKFLSERMVKLLPITLQSIVGCSEWESNEDGTSIISLLSSFRQLILRTYNWLSSNYYFPELLKKCFNLLLQSYLESFYINTLSNGITNASMVASNLHRDYMLFVTFFNGTLFEQYQGKDGFYSACEINQQLQVIQCMSRLINPTVPPSELIDDASRLMAITSDNTDYDDFTPILHIAGLRSSCHEGKEKSTEWHEMIEIVQNSMKGNETGVFHRIKLPYLRNSFYVETMEEQSSNTEYPNNNNNAMIRFGNISNSVEKVITTIVQKQQQKQIMDHPTTTASVTFSKIISQARNNVKTFNLSKSYNTVVQQHQQQ